MDYGPGGGSLAARISTVVLADEAASTHKSGGGGSGGCNGRAGGRELRPIYFTQRHCQPGPLPASWLSWLKQPVQQAAAVADGPGGGAVAVEAASGADGALAGSRGVAPPLCEKPLRPSCATRQLLVRRRTTCGRTSRLWTRGLNLAAHTSARAQVGARKTS